ncbi:hypothetical protein ACVRY7_02385 [Streptococcus ictaluri]|uniref:Uncharacterized protein n=1 Tax=Streptococcus ictaluri 707-05 TaxID=764299 RepID=G5K2E4_9STRE|nr:hypothetical protein [Streptococcus ictaluri]EHI69406.1 hypothetical protein STRIC_0956 [Streptococcus ictaluri 707-05]
MNRERVFELLESPYTPYIFVESTYVIVAIVFNIKLSYINKLLNQNFDVDRMIVQKDVMIATDVMSFNHNTSWNYLLWGVLLIIIGFAIPMISASLNKLSYKREEIKGGIMMIICAMIIVNIMIIISISKVLLSPIIIATLILCAIGTLFAFGSSQS